MEKMGDKIKRLREFKELSQKELGALLGVSNQCISRYESGAVEPKLDVFVKMLKIFGVDANYLLDIHYMHGVKPMLVYAEDIKVLEQYHQLSEPMKTVVDTMLTLNVTYPQAFSQQTHFVAEEEGE